MGNKVFEIKMHTVDESGNSATETYNMIGTDDVQAREKAVELWASASSNATIDYCETRYICSVDE